MGKKFFYFKLGLFSGIITTLGGVGFGGYYVYQNVAPEVCQPLEEMFEDYTVSKMSSKLNANKISKIDFKYVTLNQENNKNIFSLNGNLVETNTNSVKSFSLISEITNERYESVKKKFDNDYDKNKDLITNYNIDGIYHIYNVMTDSQTKITNMIVDGKSIGLSTEQDIEKEIVEALNNKLQMNYFSEIDLHYVETNKIENDHYFTLVADAVTNHDNKQCDFSITHTISSENYQNLIEVLPDQINDSADLCDNYNLIELAEINQVVNDVSTELYSFVLDGQKFEFPNEEDELSM